MRLISPDLKLETELEEECEVDTAALNTGKPRQCEGFLQHGTGKDLLMREELIRAEVVNINYSKYKE